MMVPPYSMAVISLFPAAPQLSVLPSAAGKVVLNLQGQSDVVYQIQTSTNLSSWTSISTNTLTGNSLQFTNDVVGAGARLWRAVWSP